MFDNASLFGYQSDNPAARAAYDMCIIADEQRREEEDEEYERDRSSYFHGWRWF